MYGDEPDRWERATCAGTERLRFTINVLTRLRVCTADGRVDLASEGRAAASRPRRATLVRTRARAGAARRASSSGTGRRLGFVQRDGVVGLDTGCVWGGALTAVDLDRDRAADRGALRGAPAHQRH